LEHRDFNFKIKAAGDQGDQGTFSGLAATYDLDQGNDRIVPGAFTRTLQSSKVFPLLWQHQSDNPIGSVKCTETTQGLEVEGSILLSDAVGKKAFDLMKAQVIRGLSIGYSTLQESFDNGVRLLKEVKLFEVSAVTFPMNAAALIASVKNVKALSDSARAKHLKSLDEHRRAIDRHQRLMRGDLKSLFGDDMFSDDNDDENDSALLESEAMSTIIAEMKALTALANA
jgi:HK97 family phage prohead protease